MKKCWYVRSNMTDPTTGSKVAECWMVYRRWFWHDALDIVNMDIVKKTADYPGMLYNLEEIKEV